MDLNEIQLKKNLIPVLREIIRIGAFLALLTPIVISDKFFFPYVGPKSLYFMGLVQIIFACWLLLILFSPKHRPRSNLLLWVIVLFLFYITFSSIFGVDFSSSFWSKHERMTGLLMLFHLFAFFLVLSSTFKKKRDWYMLFGFSVFVAVMIAIVSFKPDIIAMLKGARRGATLGNSSFLGSYLIFNLFLALFLFIRSCLKKGVPFSIRSIFGREKLLWKILSFIAFGIIFAALFVSTARASSLCALGGLALLILLFLAFAIRKQAIRRVGACLLLAAIVLGFVALYLAFQPSSFVYQKLVQTATAGRFVTAKIAWQGWRERPWLGWGQENFDAVFAKHFNPCSPIRVCGGETWYDRAHNIVADTGVTSGFLGLFSYLSIFGTAFYLLFRQYRKKKEFWVPAIFTVILIAYFLQNLTVFDMVSSYMMFFLVLAFIASYTTKVKPPSEKEVSLSLGRTLLAIILIILMIISFLYFVIQPMKSSKYVNRAMQTKNPAERVAWYKEALEATPLGKYQIRDYFAKNTIGFARSRAMEEFPRGDFKTEVEFIIKELEKTMEESPLDFRSSLTLSQVYSLYDFFFGGDFTRAEENAKKSIELSPLNQQGFWALSQIKIYQNDFQEALALAEKAVELEPRLADSHLVAIKVAVIIKDEDLARAKAEEALRRFPELKPRIEEIFENPFK